MCSESWNHSFPLTPLGEDSEHIPVLMAADATGLAMVARARTFIASCLFKEESF